MRRLFRYLRDLWGERGLLDVFSLLLVFRRANVGFKEGMDYGGSRKGRNVGERAKCRCYL